MFFWFPKEIQNSNSDLQCKIHFFNKLTTRIFLKKKNRRKTSFIRKSSPALHHINWFVFSSYS